MWSVIQEKVLPYPEIKYCASYYSINMSVAGMSLPHQALRAASLSMLIVNTGVHTLLMQLYAFVDICTADTHLARLSTYIIAGQLTAGG